MFGAWDGVGVSVSDGKCVEEDIDDDSRDIRSDQAGESVCVVRFRV
jgi:hypothetical protein